MTCWTEDGHPSLQYYDGDYPSQYHTLFPENLDEKTADQGLAWDVRRYLEIASQVRGPVLELCCGTGRVAIPLARAGHAVTGVDISAELLRQCRANLARVAPEIATTCANAGGGSSGHITLVEQDVTRLSLDQRDFSIGIVAFNSLLCVADFEAQRAFLRRVGEHLRRGALLLLDIVNPVLIDRQGDPVPKLFFTKNPHTGATYMRFSIREPVDVDQRQRVHGWYDELDVSGHVKRSLYSWSWRMISRFEIELMLAEAGFGMLKVEGGHRGEPFGALSPHMFIHAERS